MSGRTTAVRLLLESGANVNAASKHGWTLLMAAAWEGYASVISDLLKHGANATLGSCRTLLNRRGELEGTCQPAQIIEMRRD